MAGTGAAKHSAAPVSDSPFSLLNAIRFFEHVHEIVYVADRRFDDRHLGHSRVLRNEGQRALEMLERFVEHVHSFAFASRRLFATNALPRFFFGCRRFGIVRHVGADRMNAPRSRTRDGMGRELQPTGLSHSVPQLCFCAARRGARESRPNTKEQPRSSHNLGEAKSSIRLAVKIR